MKKQILCGLVLVVLSVAAKARAEEGVTVAQPGPASDGRGVIALSGGFATSTDTTAGALAALAGVRVAPHLFVVGEFGRLANLEPSALQPTVDQSVAAASAAGLNVIGQAKVPASYGLGGLRYEIPTGGGVTPYLFGGLGFARLSSQASFTLSDPTSAASGSSTDATAQVVSSGFYTAPASETALMLGLGGGVRIPVASHIGADIGYRFSRVNSTVPTNANSMTFGISYRF